MLFRRRPSITAEQAAAGLAGRQLVLVDVRQPVELRTGRIRGAVNIPLGQLKGRLGELQRLVRPTPEDGWLRGAEQIACYIGSPRSRVYALTSARRISVQGDGSTLVARRSELDSWLRRGGGRRP